MVLNHKGREDTKKARRQFMVWPHKSEPLFEEAVLSKRDPNIFVVTKT
jgi:hypothetical protein